MDNSNARKSNINLNNNLYSKMKRNSLGSQAFNKSNYIKKFVKKIYIKIILKKIYLIVIYCFQMNCKNIIIIINAITKIIKNKIISIL